MKKMADGEFLPHELLIKGDFKAAKDAYRSMNLTESQITYTIYSYMNQKNARMEIVKPLLELAEEGHPKSAMVFSRWGDFYLKTKDKTNALLSYQKALALDPSNKELNETLKRLK
jgi:tetratricopeptide (TPR) repeat protein